MGRNSFSSICKNPVLRVDCATWLFRALAKAAFSLFQYSVWQASQEIRAAEDSPDGDQNARLQSVLASLGIIGAVLCVVSAYGVAHHSVGIMSQVNGMLRSVESDRGAISPTDFFVSDERSAKPSISRPSWQSFVDRRNPSFLSFCSRVDGGRL